MTTDNTFVLHIPTSLSDSSGGLGINYDFGGNTSTIADSAYNFLNGAFANQQGFLSNSLSNAQGFFQAQTSPVINAIGNQIKQNSDQSPSLYAGLNQLSQNVLQSISLTSGRAITAQQQIAQASIDSSTNSANQAADSGGWCFITTAVCDSLHWPDDNPILRTLRGFRDSYMTAPSRAHAVEMYYKIAPDIVEKINQRKDAKAVYLRMLRYFLIPACEAIKRNDPDIAFIIYEALIIYAKEKAKHHGNG